MSKNRNKYIPAFGLDWLTPLYDIIMPPIMRESTIKPNLVEQMGIEKGHRVLDIGCGTATLTILIKKAQPRAEVTGLDSDLKILEIARLKVAKESLSIALDQGMAFELPYYDNSFDRVVSSLVFHHLTRENKVRTFKEIFRVIKPGGELHVADFGKPHNALMYYYGSFGGEAFSPVDGKIIDIRSFDSPTPFKNRDSKEYVIAILRNEHVVKILHVKLDVSIDENVSAGDKIGTFIHNGYFIFWNDPVMHVEVRKPGDYLRASNKLRLEPEITWGRLFLRRNLELECRVEEINNRYSLLSADYDACGKVKGFAVDGGFLDGFISSNPGEGFFGIVRPQGFFRPEVSSLKITEGDGEIECGGFACCLSFTDPRIKVIPRKYGDKLFSEGERVSIKLLLG